MTKVKIAALILTKNEEIHISRAIASIRNQVDSIYVIDSLSQDNTVSIASKEGPYVLLRPCG